MEAARSERLALLLPKSAHIDLEHFRIGRCATGNNVLKRNRCASPLSVDDHPLLKRLLALVIDDDQLPRDSFLAVLQGYRGESVLGLDIENMGFLHEVDVIVEDEPERRLRQGIFLSLVLGA